MPPKKDKPATGRTVEDDGDAKEQEKGKEECEPPTEKRSEEILQETLDIICEPRMKLNYLDYLEVVKQIEGQNSICHHIKNSITLKCCKTYRSEHKESEIKYLRGLLENENSKLYSLMQKAIRLQGNDTSGNWGNVNIATTIDEDFMPTQMDMNMSKRLTDAICNNDSLCGGVRINKTYSLPNITESQNEMLRLENANTDDFLRRVLHNLESEQDAGTSTKMDPIVIKNLLKRLFDWKEPHTERSNAYPIDRQDYDNFARNIVARDIQSQINTLQRDINSLVDERERLVAGDDTNLAVLSSNRNNKTLQKTINQMQKSVDVLKKKFGALTEEKTSFNLDQNESDGLERYPKLAQVDSELNQLKTAYDNLKLELVQKNFQIGDMRRLMIPLNSRSAAGTDNDVDDEKIEEDYEEFKCIIKEQAEQLDDYREKYMEASQKFEEQKLIINKMDINNKRIEDQISTEVQRIKTIFQEKIADLSRYPCMLESEQQKFAKLSKEKDDLEGKLKIICKELKAMQAFGFTGSSRASISGIAGETKSKCFGKKTDYAEPLRKCKIECGLLEKQHNELLKENDKIEETLKKTNEDLRALKTESSKIISRARERAECTRQSLQQHLDKIEKDLTQCRANACLSVSEREEAIKEMSGQMNTLSHSFDAAQKQIKALRTQIGFLVNDNTYPVKS